MDGSTSRQGRVLRIEQAFECSRLENALLASAYQHVVSSIRFRVVACDAESEQVRVDIGNPRQLIAKGA